MLPSRFEYHRPDSLEETLQLLSRFDEDPARFVASVRGT
jgi:CO/xanthine dehydrogenase FAD-binding subunit